MSGPGPRPPQWSPSRRALLEQRLAERGLGRNRASDNGHRAAVPPVPAPEGGPLAPRNAAELELVRIWESVLGVRPIGMRQNFFDLGGHSLLAVRLFAEIWRATGQELPVTTIFEAPTIEGIARRLRHDGDRTSWSTLVPLQPFGARAPLFCVHQHSGQIFCYQLLARHLGTEQPVYGLKAAAPAPGHPAGPKIEDMAARYIEEIRSLQPDGPYHLVGYCFGGTVAFEMARQLSAQGQGVGLLALLEAARPGRNTGVAGRIHRVTHRVAFEMDNVVRQPRGLRMAWALGRAVGVAGEQAGAFLNRMRNRFPPVAQPISPQEHAIRQIEAGHEAASRRYVPRPYPGRITLFRPAGLSARDYGDPCLGWEGLAGGGISVHLIPGGASTIVSEPSVRALAEQLRRHLEAGCARRSHSPRSAEAQETP